jgi:hypothetical protein
MKRNATFRTIRTIRIYDMEDALLQTQKKHEEQHLYSGLKLSISAPSLCCDDVAQQLVRMGVMASITPNTSIFCDREGAHCRTEPGCVVLFSAIRKSQLHRVWDALQPPNALRCAHVFAPPTFSGCLWDFLRTSKCPGAPERLTTKPK